MKIFCIGLIKTGTTSVDSALQMLGFRASHRAYIHNPIVLENRRLGRRLLHGLDHEYDAFGDHPIMKVYPELDRDYPGSKFIWTHRDLVSWLRSVERVYLNEIERDPVDPANVIDIDKWIRWYKQHMEEVPRYFAGRSDCLNFPVCSGKARWSELCDFLGVPMPDVVEFPWHNISDTAYGPYRPLPRITYVPK